MTIAAGSSGPQVENGEEIEMPEVESEDDGTVVSRSVASTTAAGGAAAPGGSVPAHDPTLRGEILGLVSSVVGIWRGRRFDPNEYLWFEQKLLVVRQSPLLRPFVGSHDNEDTVTEAYVQAIAAMEASSDLAAPYTMAGSHDLNKTLVAEDGSLHHANRGCSAYPLLPETRDVYQFLTWKWAQKRMAIENDGVASASVHVFYSSALQLCISIGLFVLGCTQLPDGDFTYIVVSIFAGVVGTAASVYGVVGALTQSEGALLAFVSGQLWTLALLSSYLHVVVELFLSNERVCNPSLANFAGSTGCTRGWLVASCLLCVILLAVSFYTVFHALNLADGVNDRAGLNDEIIILKFFQRKLDEMHMHLEAKVESLTGSPAPNEKPVGETELAGSFQTCSSFTRVS